MSDGVETLAWSIAWSRAQSSLAPGREPADSRLCSTASKKTVSLLSQSKEYAFPSTLRLGRGVIGGALTTTATLYGKTTWYTGRMPRSLKKVAAARRAPHEG